MASKNKATTRVKTVPFDAARYLVDDAAVAEYISAVLEADDPELLVAALGDIARKYTGDTIRLTVEQNLRMGKPRIYFEGNNVDNDSLQELLELLENVETVTAFHDF